MDMLTNAVCVRVHVGSVVGFVVGVGFVVERLMGFRCAYDELDSWTC